MAFGFPKIVIVLAGVVILLALLFFASQNGIIEKISRSLGDVEACYSQDGVNITERKIIGGNWGGSSGVLMDDGSIVLGGLDFSDRSGLQDAVTGESIRDVGFWKSTDGWNFSKFKPAITSLNKTITACGDPTIVKIPEGGYRMYFTDGGYGCHGKSAPLVSAYSKDGNSYVFEGELTGTLGVNLEAVDFTVFYEKSAHKYYIYTRSGNPDEADVLESSDGRYITRRFKISTPFGFQFSVIAEGDHYIAYGQHLPEDAKPNSNLRYPVRATSEDGLSWERTPDQPMGSWTGDRTYCGTYAVVGLPNGYYFY